VKNLKLLFSLVLAAGCVTMIGCSKSNNNSSTPPAASSDSVLYTNWTPLSMNGFILNSGDTFFSQTIIAKSITSAVINRGIVLGYLMFQDPNSGDTVIQPVGNYMTFLVYPDSIFLESDPFNPSPSSGFNFSGYNFRYVVIPGKILTSGVSGAAVGAAQNVTAAQLSTMSYADVKRLFNLPDLFNTPKGSTIKSLQLSPRKR
jgi:hypothetical protein